MNSLPINYWPQINLTHYVFNNTRNICSGSLASYTALQSNCFTNSQQCCNELALRDNISLDVCNGSEIYHCAQVTNPPNADVIGAFEWVLIASGGVAWVIFIFMFFYKCYLCMCRRSEYRELA